MSVFRPRLIIIADQATVQKRWSPSEFHSELLRLLSGLSASSVAQVALMDRDRGCATRDSERLKRLEMMRRVTSLHGAMLIVNGRSDLAMAVDADGVQLPERGLPAHVVRSVWPGLRIGRSCHDRAGLERAQEDGADWATLAPVNRPLSKTLGEQQPTLGTAGWATATRDLSLPVFALGGMTPDTGRKFHRVAAIGAVWLASCPLSATQDFLACLGDLTSRP